MWIAVIGASSTGKELIASLLKNREFENIQISDRIVKTELDYLILRSTEQLKAQFVMFEKNVFTGRTIWDSFEVMTKTARDVDSISQEEFEKVEKTYNIFNESGVFQPPNMVIFTRMEKKDIQNRTLLQGRRPDDREISRQFELYEEFVARIRVPKIELNMSNSPEIIADELNYSIDSVRSMVLTQQTIWKRSMFY